MNINKKPMQEKAESAVVETRECLIRETKILIVARSVKKIAAVR